MLLFNGFLLLIAFSSTTGEDNEITTVMKKLEIIPDVLTEAPLEFLQATYPQGVVVDKGKELTPTQTRFAPELEWNADPNSYYTILMTTPDAPTYGDRSLGEWLHWLVVNVHGNFIEGGNVVSPYIGIAGKKDKDFQRYLILVFKQTEYIIFDETALNDTSYEGHSGFNTRKFMEKYGMGTPVAGNVFQTLWDESVPGLRKQLNMPD